MMYLMFHLILHLQELLFKWPCLCWKTGASPGYEAVLNVASNSAPQNSLDVQSRCNANLALKVDGDSKL